MILKKKIDDSGHKQEIDPKELKAIEDEVQIMKHVNHPNCIAFHDMFESKEKIYIVMELLTGGELFDRIIDAGHFSETEAANCFKQIMDAVKYLHEIGIVHRDIKPENILYSTREPSSLVKLADFGLGKMLDVHGTKNTMTHMKTVCGTPSYLAPEVIERKGYGKECDIWSSGVILYILLSGCPPFDQSLPITRLFKDILAAKYDFPDDCWHGVSADAKDLVRKMLVVNTQRRFTPEQVLGHPWMLAFNGGSLSREHLTHLQVRLKEWQATRRLKSAINTFIALLRMSSSACAEPPDEATQAEILKQVHSDPARLEVLESSFQTLDRNKTGAVDVEDLEVSLKALGVSKTHEELVQMIRRFDVKKRGSITFDEFCIMMGPAFYDAMTPGTAKAQEAELYQIFQAFDLQKTGTINKLELKEIMRRLGMEVSDSEIEGTLGQVDSNHDGVIDWEEFKAFMKTKIYGDK